MKRKGASGSPWRTPVSILKTSVFPSGVMTKAEVFSYITLIAATISGGIPYEERIFNIFFLSIESKIRIFKSTVEPIFLYGCESWTMTKSLAKKVDGTYTRMLRRVKNVSWRAHMSNEQLYGPIPKLSATIKRRRLTLAGHVSRHKEPAGSLIFWAPEEPRRRGRPNTTLLDVLKSDTGLNNDELRAAMTDRSIWKTNFIMSPD